MDQRREDRRSGLPTLAALSIIVVAFMVLSLLVTATGTARFAIAMGYGAAAGYAVGAIFDLAKGVLPVALLALLARRAFGTAVLLGAAWICLVAFSCLATHATVSTAISAIERTGTWKMETRSSAKAELAAVEQQLATLSRPAPPRPATTVREALASTSVPPGIWKDSGECANIRESPYFAKACAQVVLLRRELAAAQDYERLSSRASELRKALAEAPIVATADPLPAAFSATLGRVLPIGGTEGVALLLTTVVELMSSFGLASVAALHRTTGHGRPEMARDRAISGQQTEMSPALPKIDRGSKTALEPAQGRLPDLAQVIQFPSAQERSTVRPPTESRGLPAHARARPGRASGQTRKSAHPTSEGAARPVHGPAQGRANHHAAARAVRTFVGLLERGPGARATGSELFHAYAAQRLAHGWPDLKPNIFGMHLKAAVAELGGRKLKSGGQVYDGVRIPAAWRAQVA